MSAGGVFKLIANDGKADRMIMATELLNQRIKDIMCMRSAQDPKADPTPSLVDIERTHILFVNSHFKPFAAIAYEYGKTGPTSGTAGFGQDLQFSIPQLGDFINDMVVNAKLSAVSATSWLAGNIPAYPAAIGATVISAQQSATDDATNGIYKRYTYQYVNAAGEAVDRSTYVDKNYVRYCEYPGQRLLQNVKFEVNGNPLDEYTVEAMNMHQKFCVAPGKMTGWKRLVGQEVPVEAYSDLATISGASLFPADHTGLVLAGGSTPAPVAPTVGSLSSRRLEHVVYGPQTPKALQPALDMWLPLLFWFNRDTRLSIASVSIPYGQRWISLKLAEQDKLVHVAPGNLFLRLTTEVFTSAGANKGTKTAAALSSIAKYETFEPVVVPQSTVGAQTIESVQLYINNIFVNPEIHDIYIRRIGFSLIRVYRTQTFEIAEEKGEKLLSQFKWPIETIYAGLRPVFNTTKAVRNGLAVTSGNAAEARDWHRFTRNVDQVARVVSSSSSQLGLTNADPTAITPADISAVANASRSLVQSGRVVFPEARKTVTTLGITAHGIDIYKVDDFKSEFFSSYQPYNFGGYNISTPEDEGAMMVNFCLYPGTYQPSGHLNVSRAREFYIKWSSTFAGVADNDDPAKPQIARASFVCVAIAINFLLISDGSAVLRYST